MLPTHEVASVAPRSEHIRPCQAATGLIAVLIFQGTCVELATIYSLFRRGNLRNNEVCTWLITFFVLFGFQSVLHIVCIRYRFRSPSISQNELRRCYVRPIIFLFIMQSLFYSLFFCYGTITFDTLDISLHAILLLLYITKVHLMLRFLPSTEPSTEPAPVETTLKTYRVYPHSCTDPCTVCPCSICYESCTNLITLRCAHNFHPDCIKSWLEKNNSCPLCRLQDP